MSASLTSTFGAIEGAAAGVAGIAGLLTGSALSDFLSSLQTASWRGVPFAVTSAGIKPGRQTAVHVYPFSNGASVWVEDTGLGPRPFSLSGFLIAGDLQLGGASLSEQESAMIAACETAGSGTLVHPTLGSRLVSLIGGCEMVHHLGAVGVIELRFQFMGTTAGPQYAGGTSATGDNVDADAASADDAASGDFASSIGSALQTGAEAVGSAASTVTSWAAKAQALVGDASRAVNAVSGLRGTFGRYTGSRVALHPATATVGSLIAASITGATAVRSASSAAISLAEAL